jgi:hypothetical protein
MSPYLYPDEGQSAEVLERGERRAGVPVPLDRL